jgi:hypothetical protein
MKLLHVAPANARKATAPMPATIASLRFVNLHLTFAFVPTSRR